MKFSQRMNLFETITTINNTQILKIDEVNQASTIMNMMSDQYYSVYLYRKPCVTNFELNLSSFDQFMNRSNFVHFITQYNPNKVHALLYCQISSFLKHFDKHTAFYEPSFREDLTYPTSILPRPYFTPWIHYEDTPEQWHR